MSLEPDLEPLERLLERPGQFLEPLGRHLGALGGSQAVIWVIWGAARRILGPLGAFLEPSRSLVGRSWESLGELFGVSWAPLDSS